MCTVCSQRACMVCRVCRVRMDHWCAVRGRVRCAWCAGCAGRAGCAGCARCSGCAGCHFTWHTDLFRFPVSLLLFLGGFSSWGACNALAMGAAAQGKPRRPPPHLLSRILCFDASLLTSAPSGRSLWRNPIVRPSVLVAVLVERRRWETVDTHTRPQLIVECDADSTRAKSVGSATV